MSAQPGQVEYHVDFYAPGRKIGCQCSLCCTSIVDFDPRENADKADDHSGFLRAVTKGKP